MPARTESHRPALDAAESTRHAAQLYRALGHVARLSIALQLARAPRMCAHVLATHCHLRELTVKRHLRTLQRLGAVHASKRGDCTLYALDPQVLSLLGPWLTQPSTPDDPASC